MSPRSSARTERSPGSASSGSGRLRGPGIAALLERARVAPGAVDLETVVVRPRPAPQCRGPRRRGDGGGPTAAGRRRRRGHGPRRCPRTRERRTARPHEGRGRRGSGPRRRRTGCACDRSSADRGRSGSSGSSPLAWPRIAAVPPSSGRTSGTSSGPRAGVTGSSTSGRPSSRAATCSSATAGTPAPPGSRSRPTAGTSSARASSRSAAVAAPPDPRVTLPIDLALPARDVDYALYRELADLAPCGPGNPEPLVAVLGLTVTRVRAATGGHTQLTLRRELRRARRHRLRPRGPGRDRPRGRPGRRRGRLASRTFGGFESLQLEIRDVVHGSGITMASGSRPIRSSGSHPRWRSCPHEPAGAAQGPKRRRPVRRDARRVLDRPAAVDRRPRRHRPRLAEPAAASTFGIGNARPGR